MHDGKKTYYIVYDRADDDLDEVDKKNGTTVLLASWEEVLQSKTWGLVDPVLVRQFEATSWEQAMQTFHDMHAYGPYRIGCQNPKHEGDPLVRWVNDDGTCRTCLAQEK